ncbi:ScyD/ScyE family protein [Thermomonospora umbrina]|uniref:ScyD/ScyE family protein n=1 Tax=Thermomonospora umbrina TaxID=111806 RepID=A0A3D9SY97_9ACTN|nr:ScyD/ScyE family protein [Thermomonospora umbrina]REE97965.1 hypothetical protein DFJ69_3445 [Thermomonospora umbrina]
MSRSRKHWTAACLVAAGGLTAAALPPGTAGAVGVRNASLQVIAQGLNSPRGVTVLPDGTVLVAEAGHGGRGPCVGSGELRSCFGHSGSIFRLQGRDGRRIVRGLPSISDAGGREASGPVQVMVHGRRLLVLSGAGLNGSQRAAFGAGALPMGTLYALPGGRILADLVRHETVYDPDWVLPRNDPRGEAVHSNPWRFVRSGHGGWLVTDAGANDLIRVGPRGRTHTEALFPHNRAATTGGAASGQPRRLMGLHGGGRAQETRQVQSVPTGLVRGPDGAYYVGELAGFAPGASRIWRIVPGHRPRLFVSGLTAVSDLALDRHGNLLALSLTRGLAGFPQTPPLPGALYRIDLRSKRRTEIPTGGTLMFPTGLGVGRHGEIYVSNRGVGTGAGQLLRLHG